MIKMEKVKELVENSSVKGDKVSILIQDVNGKNNILMIYPAADTYEDIYIITGNSKTEIKMINNDGVEVIPK